MTPPSSTPHNITHIAELARIKLTDEEIAGFVKKQQMVLEYIAQLQRIKSHALTYARTTDTHTAHPRPDEITRTPDTSANPRILDSSPLREGVAVKIVSVFK